MGAKACLILSILLLSYILIPAYVTAREMLQEPQTAEELRSDIGEGSTIRNAYEHLTCQKGSDCPGSRPRGHVMPPGKGLKGKPYARPRVPYNPPGHRYGRTCKSRHGCRLPAP